MQLTSLRLLFTALILQAVLWAAPDTVKAENNISEDDKVAQKLLIKASIAENDRLIRARRAQTIDQFRTELEEINLLLAKDNVWEKSYSSHIAYAQVRGDHASLQAKIKTLSKKRNKSDSDLERLEDLKSKEKILSEQFKLLDDTQQGRSVFAALLQPEEIEEIPVLTNPLDIFTAVSFVKHLEEIYADYLKRGVELKEVTSLLRKKKELLANLHAIHEACYSRKWRL